MSDPRRLFDRDPVSAALIGAARRYQPPPRTRRRALKALGLSATLTASLSTAAATVTGASSTLKISVLACLFGAGSGVTAVHHARRSVPARQPTETIALHVRPKTAAGPLVSLPPKAPAPARWEVPAPFEALSPRPTTPATRRNKPITARDPGARSASAPAPATAFTGPKALLPPSSSSPSPSTHPDAASLSPPAPASWLEPSTDLHSGRRPRTVLSALALELALLENADRALRAGKPREALAALDEHERSHPIGELRDEATALRVAALWKVGEHQAALRLGRSFIARSPDSLLARRIEATLAGATAERSKGAP